MSSLTGSTALVTGATGFVGGALARQLADQGVQVKALARRAGRDSYIRDVKNIEIVFGDITDAERMKAVTAECDYVFHVAAALGGKLNYQQAVNIGGTENVARAAASAGVKRLIHVSSIAVYGYQLRAIITEDMPHIPGNVPYNITKSGAEKILAKIAADTGLSYTINRPGMIYGPRSNAWTVTLFKLAKRQPVPFIGDGSGSAFPIYIDDVTNLLMHQATHPAADGEAFNCVYQPQPSQREFLEGYMQLIGNTEWRAVPLWLAKLLAPLADVYCHLSGEPRDIQDALRMLESTITYSMDKSKNVLDWEPEIALKEGIERCVPYLQERGLL